MKLSELKDKFLKKWKDSPQYKAVKDIEDLEKNAFNQGFDMGIDYARNPPIMSLDYLGFHYVTKFRNENPFDFNTASESQIQEYLEQMVKYACACVKIVYEHPIIEDN